MRKRVAEMEKVKESRGNAKKTKKKRQDVYLIVGDANAGKTSIVKMRLRGKYHTRKPTQIQLVSGGTIDVFCQRSQAEQEAKIDPQTCCANLKKNSVKFSFSIDFIVVLRLNHGRWPSQQYVTAIQKAGYNIKATVVLDTKQNLPKGTKFPNPVFLGRINTSNYRWSLNRLYKATNAHFCWK